ALALRNSWLLRQVQRMADTDPLTGIANRRFFDSMLGRELARARRSEIPLSLMMVDVDHFKAFNDEHGHLAGDLALKTTARCLEKGCRNFDTVARYGGEEFAIILPECSSSEAHGIADRLRRSVSSLDIGAPITVSIGIATFPLHGTDAHDLTRAADQALYESKRAGRDRVTGFGEGLKLPADVLAALREELG
ncbi:MAG: GGDEF domain-containing protein, partial [Actinomycetota bacterium]